MPPSRRVFLSASAATIASAAAGLSTDNGDYEDQNGVRVYKQGKTPQLPKDAPRADFTVASLYGYRLLTVKDKDGKPTVYWMAATEADLRRSEAKRLKIKPEEVKVPDPDNIRECFNTGPQTCDTSFCQSSVVPFCRLIYNPDTGHSYCRCSK